MRTYCNNKFIINKQMALNYDYNSKIIVYWLAVLVVIEMSGYSLSQVSYYLKNADMSIASNQTNELTSEEVFHSQSEDLLGTNILWQA